MARPRRFSSITRLIQISLTTQGMPPTTPCSRVRPNHNGTLWVKAKATDSAELIKAAPQISGTAPSRAATAGTNGVVAIMPTPQAAPTMPIRNLSTPCRSRASGTSGMEVPTWMPKARQAT